MMKYFVANWKANKNLQDVEDWMDKFLTLYQPNDDKLIIICPPFPFLINLKQKINQTKNLKLGAQDISAYEEGTYTGEVTAKTLQGLTEFALIGHSEKKKLYKETNEMIEKKIFLAKKYQIEPILCIQDSATPLNHPPRFVAYEPPWAISQGYSDSMATEIEETPEKAIEVKKKLKLAQDICFIYGGSVNPSNVTAYLKNDQINGVLVGGASLNPTTFYQIVSSA